MPELDYAMLAEHVLIQRGTAHILGGGWDGIETNTMPVTTNVTFLIRIGFDRAECERPHRVEVIVQDEDGDRRFHLTRTLKPKWPGRYPIAWKFNEQFKFGVPITFTSYGIHDCTILLNDSLVKRIPFIVKPGSDTVHPPTD